MLSTDRGLQTPRANFRHPQKLHWNGQPRELIIDVNFCVATFIPNISDVYSVSTRLRSGIGSVSMLPVSGASGVEMILPLFLKVRPATLFSFLWSCRLCVSSSVGFSPSPRTIMSICGYFLRILSALNVAW